MISSKEEAQRVKAREHWKKHDHSSRGKLRRLIGTQADDVMEVLELDVIALHHVIMLLIIFL